MFGAPPAPPSGTEREAAADALEHLADDEQAAPAAPEAATSSPAELRALLDALFTAWNLCAAARESWARWSLTPAEHKILVEAWLPVAVKYEAALRLGPEVGALLVTVAVLAPRLTRTDDARPLEPHDAGPTPGYRVE